VLSLILQISKALVGNQITSRQSNNTSEELRNSLADKAFCKFPISVHKVNLCVLCVFV